MKQPESIRRSSTSITKARVILLQMFLLLSTTTKATDANFIYANIPYLKNVNAAIDADIEIDNKDNKYTFQTDDIILNDLKLSSKGFFQVVNDSMYDMDISFNSPSNDFKHILSLIPAVYQKDFDKIKAGGKAVFKGFVKGTYSPNGNACIQH